MSNFINLKKITANALVGTLLIGGAIVQSSSNEAVAGSCSNNGHGNNLPSTIGIASEKLTVGHYDPSNPGEVKNKLIKDLKDGKFGNKVPNGRPYYINYTGSSLSLKESEATDIVNMLPDWEKASSGCDMDNDGIDDVLESGNDFDNPLDTDGDGIPNHYDTDSDGDGISDSIEGIVDLNNNGIPDFLDVASVTTENNDTDNSPSTEELATCPASGTIEMVGTIRDFLDTHPDFEYRIGDDRNMVTTEISSDNKPVYAHPNGTTKTTTGKANFNQWYRDVAGVNQSMPYSITLEKQDNGLYRYQNTSFFPIDNQLLGNQGRKHNYHFTYELHGQFTYKGGEVLDFSGDDDVWVYINGKRVIDIGGVHARQDASVNLDEVADEIGIEKGETYNFNFFFAERHTTQSNFILETSIEILCDSDKDGIANIVEGNGDIDGDDIPNYLDTDSDGDRLLDADDPDPYIPNFAD